MRILAAAALVAVAYSMPAHAACEWQWDCSRGFPCRQVPICESTFDIPMPAMPGVSPIPMPTIPPITMPMVPPVGTRSCQPRYLCNFGQCGWETVCQ